MANGEDKRMSKNLVAATLDYLVVIHPLALIGDWRMLHIAKKGRREKRKLTFGGRE